MTPALEQIKALPAKWRAEATELRRNAIAARANGAATVDDFARADRLDAKADGLHETAQALDTALQALRDEAGEAIHPDTKRRLLQEAADYDKGEEFAKAKAIGIRSAIEQIEQQHRLIRPAPAAEAAPQGAYEGVGCVFCDLNAEHWGELCTAATPPSAPAVDGLRIEVKPSECACHPETCNCPEYFVAVNGELWSTGSRGFCERLAEKILRLSAPVPQEGADAAMVERALRAFWQAYGDQQRLGGGRQAGRTAAGIRAVLALAAGALPQGGVLVPREPTPEMVEAGAAQLRELRAVGVARDETTINAIYDGMLAAAPAQGVR